MRARVRELVWMGEGSVGVGGGENMCRGTGNALQITAVGPM